MTEIESSLRTLRMLWRDLQPWEVCERSWDGLRKAHGVLIFNPPAFGAIRPGTEQNGSQRDSTRPRRRSLIGDEEVPQRHQEDVRGHEDVL